ncbi:unnamed protein product [Ranitomeya imitator]|uniref:VWFD domain-containing protein n=1 Tax=Ranitomeya imitator TaxID=111125 RepID=A0ABN9MN77_9NEOB|nr:unnamed protein product [Ranitomeya imitator]
MSGTRPIRSRDVMEALNALILSKEGCRLPAVMSRGLRRGPEGEFPLLQTLGTIRIPSDTWCPIDLYWYRVSISAISDTFRVSADTIRYRYFQVDGQTVTLPIHLAPDVDVGISGWNVLVTTGFGLQVWFDGNQRVQVTIPGYYSGKVCGLCGNFNGNPADDFLNPDGVLEPDSNSLGNSWQVDNDTSCSPGVDHPSSCTDEEKEIIASNSFCGIITDKNGPFTNCHNVINPLVYFDNCAYDLCETNLDREILCYSLQSYAESCQSQNVNIEKWRNDTFCPPKCPPNSHFQHCGTACPATYVNPWAPYTCSLPCTESCICDEGYVLYGNKCVPEDKCRCWDDDVIIIHLPYP